jgi:Ca2+-binding EF-hand superfamily protein
MRFLAIAFLLLFPAICFAQPPGGGMFGQGGGGRFGGGGGRGFDPNQLFNMMSNGKDVVSRADITNPGFQRMFDRFAEQAGVTNGQLTREQFAAAMQARMGQRGQGGPGAGGGAQATPPGTDANNANSWVERSFRRLDQNGDGLLNYDEMAGDETLRAERDKWDANKDGFIDLTEYRAYAEARAQQRQAERGQTLEGVPMVVEEATPAEEEEKKPVVYRAGKLPKELPGWFAQLDTDNDGQIGLYEWRAGGRSIEDFQQIDRNGDGFLTIEEVLRYGRPNGKQAVAGGPSPANFRPDAQAFNPGGDAAPRFGGGGFNRSSQNGNSSDGQGGGGRRRGRGFGAGGGGGNGSGRGSGGN